MTATKRCPHCRGDGYTERDRWVSGVNTSGVVAVAEVCEPCAGTGKVRVGYHSGPPSCCAECREYATKHAHRYHPDSDVGPGDDACPECGHLHAPLHHDCPLVPRATRPIPSDPYTTRPGLWTNGGKP